MPMPVSATASWTPPLSILPTETETLPPDAGFLLGIDWRQADMRDLPWPEGFEVRSGATRQDDPVSVTACLAAVAETGSLVLVSGPATPTTLNFTPDDMIAVLHRRDVVAHQEEVWQRLRRERSAWPRTVNFVSGPSRTADIEQVVQLGVHGPRRVHIILVDEVTA